MSTVDFELFSARLAEALDMRPEALTTTTPLAAIAAFDSMGKINVSLLIEELFGFQIDYETLDGAETAGALYESCVVAQPA